MKLEWTMAPTKTQWGHDMVEASIAIDNDHTLSLYCERSQIAKVEAMFGAQPEGVQVNVKEFVRTVIYKEDIVGRPVIWAQWPNKENT